MRSRRLGAMACAVLFAAAASPVLADDTPQPPADPAYEEWRLLPPQVCDARVPADIRRAEWEAWWSGQAVFGSTAPPAGYLWLWPDPQTIVGRYNARYFDECVRGGDTIIPSPSGGYLIIAVGAPPENVEALIAGQFRYEGVPATEIAIAIRAYRAAVQAAAELAAAGKAGHPTLTYAEWKHPDVHPAGFPWLWDHDEPLEVRRQRNGEWWAARTPFETLPEPMNYAVLRPHQNDPIALYHARFLAECRQGGDTVVPFIDRRGEEPEQVYLVVAVGAPRAAVEALIRGQLRLVLVPKTEIAVAVAAYRLGVP